jgi:GntR family transcriptional regulator / MocR family aminotransferase
MARHAEHQALALPIRPPHVPIQRWLYEEIRTAILSGRLSSGQRLPPTRDFAHQFGIARGTVVGAFEQLAAEGYVTAAVGRGTHVASSLPDNLFAAGTSPAPQRKRSVRAIRLSDRAQPLARSPFPLTAPTTAACAFRAGQPDLVAFPPRALVSDWKPIGSTRAALASRGRRCRGLPTLARSHRRLSRDLTRDLLFSRAGLLVASVQQGLDLCARLLVNPGETAWIEDPGYPAACSVLEAASAKVVPVPVDAHGLDMAEGRRSASRAKLAYVTPGRQYPLGIPLNLDRRLHSASFSFLRSGLLISFCPSG